MSSEDAHHHELADGARVVVRSETGEMNGIIQIAPVKSGTLPSLLAGGQRSGLPSHRSPFPGSPITTQKVSIEKIYWLIALMPED